MCRKTGKGKHQGTQASGPAQFTRETATWTNEVMHHARKLSTTVPLLSNSLLYLTTVDSVEVGRNDFSINKYFIPLHSQNKTFIKCPECNIIFYPIWN